jgi:hypothetical protein
VFANADAAEKWFEKDSEGVAFEYEVFRAGGGTAVRSGYPVCLRLYDRTNYYECRYTSQPQCNASASGRSAQCVINPYFASAQGAGYRQVY